MFIVLRNTILSGLETDTEVHCWLYESYVKRNKVHNLEAIEWYRKVL